MDDKIVEMEISDSSRSGDVIEMVAKAIDLLAYLDFKLVICDESKKTLRVLDDDEILVKVYLKYTKTVRKSKETSSILKSICSVRHHLQAAELFGVEGQGRDQDLYEEDPVLAQRPRE